MLNLMSKTHSNKRITVFAVSFITVILGIALLAHPVFAMTKVGALALYFVIWWVVLFIALPLGVDSSMDYEHDSYPLNGLERGAPAAPKMLRKAILTTWLSSVVFSLAAYGLIVAGF